MTEEERKARLEAFTRDLYDLREKYKADGLAAILVDEDDSHLAVAVKSKAALPSVGSALRLSAERFSAAGKADPAVELLHALAHQATGPVTGMPVQGAALVAFRDADEALVAYLGPWDRRDLALSLRALSEKILSETEPGRVLGGYGTPPVGTS